VYRVSLRRRLMHGHSAAVKAAVMAGIVTAVAVAVAAAVILARPAGHTAPAPAPGTAPALIYTTSTSVDLRTGNGSVRTLATFPKGAGFTGPLGFGSVQLAWSADASKVAWLDGQGVGEFIVGRDQVRTWQCDCSSIAFQGDRLLSDDFKAENPPRLLSYPDDGSKPGPIVISGLPKSRFPSLEAYSLDAALPPDDVIVGYGPQVSVSDGPQLLYRVDAEGRAVPFAPAARQFTSNVVPEDFVFSPDGTQVGFLLGGHGGFCVDSDSVVLANVATGAETRPAMPTGMRYALAVWFGPSDTPYASMAPAPPGCAQIQNTAANITVSPQDYRLEAGTWVRSGSGVIDEESSRGGREATLYGKVDSTPVGASASTDLRLVVSRGSSSATIPGALAFVWAPAKSNATPSLSPASSPISSPSTPASSAKDAAIDEAAVNDAFGGCRAFSQTGCPMTVATTPNGNEGSLIAVGIQVTGDDYQAVVFFDNTAAIGQVGSTAYGPFGPHLGPPGANKYAHIAAAGTGKLEVAWFTWNRSHFSGFCCPNGPLVTWTYQWNGQSMQSSGPQLPKGFEFF
jgi:hypothetical protein